MMRIGVFGGTFDPPHLGHLILAEEAISQLNLEYILFVLTASPPHKDYYTITPIYERLILLQAAINNNQAFKLSRVDIDRPAPHYALDTMKLLSLDYPDDQLIYLLGSDSLKDLSKWHHPVSFVSQCFEIGVFLRPNVSYDWVRLDNEISGLKRKVRFVQTPLLEIASSDIRERINQQRPYRYYVPEIVYDLINTHHFYQKSRSNQ